MLRRTLADEALARLAAPVDGEALSRKVVAPAPEPEPPLAAISHAELQAMLMNASKSGGIVELPPGDYQITAPLWIPPGVKLFGSNYRAPYSTRDFPISVPGEFTAAQKRHHYHVGTTFLVTTRTGPALLLGGDGCEVHGVTFYYPDQKPGNLIWYPPTITAHNTKEFILGLAICNNLFVNPWSAIELGTPGLSKIGQIRIEGNQGQPLAAGLSLGKVLDMVRVKGTHWWPFWSGAVKPVAPAVGLRCYEADWLQVEDFFTYGLEVGVQLLMDGGRACSGTFSRINIDACNIGVDVYALAEWGVTISDLNIVCAETSPWGNKNPNRIGVVGQPATNQPWAKNSYLKLDNYRVEGAREQIQWNHPAPLRR
jgi:hypothetical protein